MLEIGANNRLKQIIARDYDSYSGRILEKYFRESLAETEGYTRIGYWHDRRGENEIDVIAADDLNQTAVVAEVKCKKQNIDMSILRAKSEAFFKATGQYQNYQITYKGLSIEDM